MNSQWFQIFSQLITLGLLTILFVIATMANVYDIISNINKDHYRKLGYRLNKNRQPSVTILVHTHNDEYSIKECLDSIRCSQYFCYDVVVVDDTSVDTTRAIVRRYIKEHSDMTLRLYTAKQQYDRQNWSYKGYRQSRKGDFVFVIDGSDTINPSLVKDCVVRFAADKNLSFLKLGTVCSNHQSITQLYDRLFYLSKTQIWKVMSLILVYRVNFTDGPIMFRSTVFATGIKQGRYDGSLAVLNHRVSNDMKSVSDTFSLKKGRRLTSMVIPIAILLVLFWQSYSMYIAANLQSSSLLWVGWLAVVAWVLLLIWNTSLMSTIEKLKLISIIPIVYFIAYAQMVIYIAYRWAGSLGKFYKMV